MQKLQQPILLFDDECGVCRHIAHWVKERARAQTGESTLIVRPIGNDPDELRTLHPDLDIWDAYRTIHVLMPDGSMRLGGQAVAVVLQNLPATRWFTCTFEISLFGFRPFQAILDLGYVVLADVRPLLGCESCGTPRPWVRPLRWLVNRIAAIFGHDRQRGTAPHSNARPTSAPRSAAGATPSP